VAHPGWFVFGGTEIINAERTAAYIQALVPQLGFKNCTTCSGLRYLVNRPETGPLVDGVPQAQSGAYIEAVTKYSTPLLDHAEWVDNDNPDTWDFCGLYPLKITGLESDTRSAVVVEGTGNGGAVLLPRKATREVKVEGLLVARTDVGLSVGRRWLRKAMDGSGCGAGEDCSGDQFCFFTACPDCTSLDGINYLTEPTPWSVPGAYGWQAFGGTWVPNTGTGKGVYTSGSAGAHYVQYSPFAAVCEDMTFTADFPDGDLSSLIQRRNIVPNPSYRTASGTSDVRKNLCKNPRGQGVNPGTKIASLWTPTTNTELRGAFGGSSYGPKSSAGNLGVQDYYIGVVSTAAQSRINLGGTTRVTLAPSPNRLYVEWLGKSFTSQITLLRMSAQFFDAGLASLGAATASADLTVSPAQYTKYEQVFTIPANAAYADVKMYVSPNNVGTNAAANSYQFMIGEVLIEQANDTVSFDGYYRGYFDGDYAPSESGAGSTGNPRYQIWTGTPNLSESVIRGAQTPSALVGASLGAKSFKGEGDHIYLYATGLDQPNTVKAMESSNLSLVAGATRYAVRCRVLAMSPVVGSLRFVLRLRAYSAVNADLGVIATTTDTAFSISNTDTEVAAPSTATLPGGTSYIRAEVWLNNTTPGTRVNPIKLRIHNVLVEPVASATTPGAFFDGSTPDTATDIYAWMGESNNSISTESDPVSSLSNDLRLEAWGDTGSGSLDTLIASTSTNRLYGQASLTIDGAPWTHVAWRVVPLNTTPLTIDAATYTWPLAYGYEDVFGGINMHPLGYYGTEPPLGTYDATTDPIADGLEAVTAKYFRTLRNTTCVAGPSVTQVYSSSNAYLAKVEMTLVAGVPWLYGDEIDVGSITLTEAAHLFSTPRDTAFLMADVIAECDATGMAATLVDPTCAVVPAPPTVPDIMSVCAGPPGPVLRRFGFRIPSNLIPEWGEVVPIIDFKPTAAAAQVNVRFYPTPVPGTLPADVDPCAMCAAFVINYSDANGITINGAEERVYSTAPESALDTNGVSYLTGRTVQRPARHLVTNLEYGPFQFPVLSCGVSYLVVIETYDEALDATMSFRLASRQ
jgi:hypothetical protein